jgi:hypothetical protein
LRGFVFFDIININNSQLTKRDKMARKLTKKEQDDFEYMCNLDPTTEFYEPSSDYELFIYKKLLFAEKQTSYMGMCLS